MSPIASRTAVDLELCRFAEHIVDNSMAPAVSLCVGVRRSDGWHYSRGTAGTVSRRSLIQVTPDTPFDLASLTKPFVAVATAQLAASSTIRLSEPLGSCLPELQDFPIGRASLEQALSHRAGLEACSPLYGRCLAGRNISKRLMLRRAASHILLEHWNSDLSCVWSAHYSDLGYLIAGAVLEIKTGKSLDSVVWESLLRHLNASVGSSRQWLASSVDFTNLVAPTEFVFWRGGTLRGIVHDENAWAWAGHGIAGHAGLFATATGVAQFGASVLDSLAGRHSSVARFAARFCTANRDGGALRAGFDGVAFKNSSAGRLISRCSFGHLGFTGTSVWCDPERDLVVVVLSNRVCPTRRNVLLPLARAEIHDRLVQWAANRGDP